MSEAKFTKGPWVKENKQVTGGFLVRPSYWNRGVCTVTQRDSHPINGMGVSWERSEANAHLIAAAPEMYEMLDEISDGLLEAGGYGNCALAKRIETLLAKARGDQ
jgi:hypothetical protein